MERARIGWRVENLESLSAEASMVTRTGWSLGAHRTIEQRADRGCAGAL